MRISNCIQLSLIPVILLVFLFPSCRPEEKPCDTALQDSLNVRELRLKEREIALQERELAFEERQRNSGGQSGTPANAADHMGPKRLDDDPALLRSKSGSGLRAEDEHKAAYKKPVLDFPGQFPESSERALEIRDVEHQTSWGMKIMLNEIYARHGFLFRDPDLRKHFARESWYKGSQKNLSAIHLTALEQQNIAFINSQSPHAK